MQYWIPQPRMGKSIEEECHHSSRQHYSIVTNGMPYRDDVDKLNFTK